MPDTHPPVVIRVRDRREAKQFSVHNLLIDQWLQIIGQPGFALYSLYVRMANNKDERCFPCYSMIAEHLRVSRSTVSDHNRLLAWCRLIHIEPGNTRYSNDYYILDVPRVTVNVLLGIRRQAEHAKPPLRFDVIKRLDTYRPIQDLWKSRRRRPKVMTNLQMTLPLDSGTLREHSSTVREHSSTVREHRGTEGVPEQSESNNPKGTIQQQQQRDVDVVDGWDLASNFNPEQNAAFNDLISTGVTPQTAAELVQEHTAGLARVQAWIDHAQQLAAEDFEFTNMPGFIVAGIKNNRAALMLTSEYRYGKD